MGERNTIVKNFPMFLAQLAFSSVDVPLSHQQIFFFTMVNPKIPHGAFRSGERDEHGVAFVERVHEDSNF